MRGIWFYILPDQEKGRRGEEEIGEGEGRKRGTRRMATTKECKQFLLYCRIINFLIFLKKGRTNSKETPCPSLTCGWKVFYQNRRKLSCVLWLKDLSQLELQVYLSAVLSPFLCCSLPTLYLCFLILLICVSHRSLAVGY